MTASVLALVRNRAVLWSVFVLVHLWLAQLNLSGIGNPYGDVAVVYRQWMDEAVTADYWVGIDAPWVYPVGALLPLLAAYALGSDLYGVTWLLLVFALDAVALGSLTGWGRRSRNLTAGWWWTVFLLLLGPVALGRLDAVTVALVILGMLLLARHPIAAAAILTLATWIKVWPAAVIAAIVIATRQRGVVLASAIGTTISIVVIAAAFGGLGTIASFITQQTGRGLQVEAPIATVWLWFAVGGGAEVYFDVALNTFQVRGDGSSTAANLMNPLLGIAAIGVMLLGVRAVRRGAAVVHLLPTLTLAFVAALIVVNKVGSPQYIAWLAAPLVLALATTGLAHRTWRMPGVLALVIAGLTQLVYPFFYDEVIALDPIMLVVLSVRNVLLVVVFGWSVVVLWRASGAPGDE